MKFYKDKYNNIIIIAMMFYFFFIVSFPKLMLYVLFGKTHNLSGGCKIEPNVPGYSSASDRHVYSSSKCILIIIRTISLSSVTSVTAA